MHEIEMERPIRETFHREDVILYLSGSIDVYKRQISSMTHSCVWAWDTLIPGRQRSERQ